MNLESKSIDTNQLIWLSFFSYISPIDVKIVNSGVPMYAIIKTGGKQYRVTKGDIIDVELLDGKQNKNVTFGDVLFFHDGKTPNIGDPIISECSVVAELVEEVKGPKVIAFKYKRRKNYHRKVGHRQRYSRVKIIDIKSAK